MPERETWLILSHAFNMDGRAASQTITDKIPHLMAHGVTPVVIGAVTGDRDRIVEHHRLLAVSPAGLRFDLRHVVRRSVTNRAAYKVATALITLPLLPFYLLERALVPLESQWSWFIPTYFRGARLIRERGCTVIYSTGGASSAHLAGYLLAKKFSLPWMPRSTIPWCRAIPRAPACGPDLPPGWKPGFARAPTWPSGSSRRRWRMRSSAIPSSAIVEKR